MIQFMITENSMIIIGNHYLICLNVFTNDRKYKGKMSVQ